MVHTSRSLLDGDALLVALHAKYDERTRVAAGALPTMVVRETLARGDLVDPHHHAVWHRFVETLRSHIHDRRSLQLCGVMANFVALAVFSDDADVEVAVRLANELGPERLAQLQHRAGALIEPDTDLPLTREVLRRLLVPAFASTPDGDAPGVLVGRALLFEGIEPQNLRTLVASVAPVRTVRQLTTVLDDGSVVEWRQRLAILAACPWGAEVERIADLAVRAERPEAVLAIAWAREWAVETERMQIAQHVQRLVAVSGASQRQSAARIGTSPSRLSSYVRGTVTPSAALFLRIQRASKAMRDEAAVSDRMSPSVYRAPA